MSMQPKPPQKHETKLAIEPPFEVAQRFYWQRQLFGYIGYSAKIFSNVQSTQLRTNR